MKTSDYAHTFFLIFYCLGIISCVDDFFSIKAEVCFFSIAIIIEIVYAVEKLKEQIKQQQSK